MPIILSLTRDRPVRRLGGRVKQWKMPKYNVAGNGASADLLGGPKLKQFPSELSQIQASPTPNRFCILELVSYATLERRCNPGQNSSLKHLVIPREKKQLWPFSSQIPRSQGQGLPRDLDQRIHSTDGKLAWITHISVFLLSQSPRKMTPSFWTYKSKAAMNISKGKGCRQIWDGAKTEKTVRSN